MIAIFLGELYSFTIGAVFFLVLAGCVLPFSAILAAPRFWFGSVRDMARTLFMPGTTRLVLASSSLPFRSLVHQPHAAAAGEATTSKRSRSAGHSAFRFFPALFVVLGLWLVFVEGGVAAWYRGASHSIKIHAGWFGCRLLKRVTNQCRLRPRRKACFDITRAVVALGTGRTATDG